MNFRVFLSAIHLIFVLMIGAIGVLFLLLSCSERVVRILSQWVLEESTELWTYMGIAFLGLGVLLFFGFFWMNGGSFLQFKMKAGKVSIDRAIVEEYVKKYWAENFPHQAIHMEILFHGKRRLELIAKLPLNGEKEPDVLLHRIQNELGVLLACRLGYECDFILTLSQS